MNESSQALDLDFDKKASEEQALNYRRFHSTPSVIVYENGEPKVVRYDHFVEKLLKKQSPELTKAHIGLGIAGEAGEFVDVVKRDINYGHTVTSEGKSIKEGVIEELGDIFWYAQAAMTMYGISWSEVLQGNANKLGKRYNKLIYSDAAAQDRADKKEGQ